ncbi:hypothetical protein [Mongoliimonas terrestris]|uniref:hypothetical protein n=1 Tax=Mongoliimonas terrestris TaxID=1709001 RepID=UPI0009497C69|nr:hypothetical protein [Mongoliimonas terrestris]
MVSTAVLALASTLASAGAGLAIDLSFGRTKILLLWEDNGGFSDDVAGVDGPIAVITDDGRSLQLVVDLILDGIPNSTLDPAPDLAVTATGANGSTLFEGTWPIPAIGDFGTTMRSFIVDHGCAPVTVAARIEAAGAVVERWERTVAISCAE